MADKEKSNKKEPEEPTVPEDQEKSLEEQPTEEIETEDQKQEIKEEVPEDEEAKEDTQETPETEETPKEEEKKPIKTEIKKEAAKKKEHGEDFQYIIRLSNTDINGEKNLIYGLTTIKGIGLHMATLIADETGLDKNIKMGDLKDPQIEKLQNAIDTIEKNAPGWMLNHRKDYDTGKDVHLIGSDIDMRLRDEINIMKKIRSYRGIRHERGLSVRGQRTRANNRKGLALGVSKKRD